jgi:hypothetical protein
MSYLNADSCGPPPSLHSRLEYIFEHRTYTHHLVADDVSYVSGRANNHSHLCTCVLSFSAFFQLLCLIYVFVFNCVLAGVQ